MKLATRTVLAVVLSLESGGCSYPRSEPSTDDLPKVAREEWELPNEGSTSREAYSEFEVKLLRIEASGRYLIKTPIGEGRAGIDTPCVLVYLEYRNNGEGLRYLSHGWPTGQLSDVSGNRYRMLTDDHILRPDKMPPMLRPGESIKDVMVFEAPIAQADMLRLYVQDHFSADSGVARGPVEISIPLDTIADPNKVIR